jgi:hypothetical protein
MAFDMATMVRRLGLNPEEAFGHVRQLTEAQAQIAVNTNAIAAHLAQLHAGMEAQNAALAVLNRQVADLRAELGELRALAAPPDRGPSLPLDPLPVIERTAS